jgi:hypothetical protein
MEQYTRRTNTIFSIYCIGVMEKKRANRGRPPLWKPEATFGARGAVFHDAAQGGYNSSRPLTIRPTRP